MTPLAAIARKEIGELVGSRRGLTWLLLVSASLSVFGLLFVSNTELSLLDNAEAVYLEMGCITALGCLFAVLTGSDALAGERERGTLVPLLLTPATTWSIVLAKMGGQLCAWLVVYGISLPYLWAVGASGQNLGAAIIYLALFGTPTVLGFGLLAHGLSARSRSVRGALAPAMIALAVLGGPTMFGPTFWQSTFGRGMDLVNPFAAALNTYDSVVVDSEPLSAQGWHLAVAVLWLTLTLGFALRSARRLEP